MWRPICACALAVCCGISVQRAAAAVPALYDAAADFSTTVNTDTSTWSYRYEEGNTPNGVYPLLPTYGPANGNWSPVNPGAWNSGSSGLPEIGIMRSAAGELAVLSWLYPYADQRQVIVNVAKADIDTHGGDGVTVYDEIRHPDGSVSAHGFGYGSDGTRGSSMTGGFLPGDRFNLILSPGPPDGPYTDDRYDAMVFTVTVTQVPEPSAALLLASGVLGLLTYGLRARMWSGVSG
jgi:hypothetical protein